MSGRNRASRARIVLNIGVDEARYVTHAAKLVRLTRREYIIRAINTQLQREGVDALLIRQSDWKLSR